MKRGRIVFFVLSGLLCLACGFELASMQLERAPVTASPAAVIMAKSTGAPVKAFAVATGAPGLLCAKVTAVRALNLRSAASEVSPPVSWLLAGDIVRLAAPPDGDWWLVTKDGRVGWARSSYLVRVDCP